MAGKPRHGGYKSAEHVCWCNMRGRCNNPRHPQYPDYGGRGITVCERWSRFENFLADMGTRPTPQHSLDRKNNDGHYSKENCRWATQDEQQSNRRSKKNTVIHQGKTIQEWAEEWGLTYSGAYHRARRQEKAAASRTYPPRVACAQGK